MVFWLDHVNLYKILIKMGVRSRASQAEIDAMVKKMGKNPQLKVNGLKMKFDKRSMQDVLIYDSISSGRGYEPGVTKILSKAIKSGMTFVDVGANSGYYTILAGSCLKGSGRIISIEPQSRVCERLLANVKLNQMKNVRLMHNAIFSKETQVEIGIPKWGDAEASIEYPGAQETETVTALTLDSVCKNPDVIKIDVEGYELEVLQGAENALKHAKHIIFEQSLRRLVERDMDPNAVIDYMIGHGFEIYDADSGKRVLNFRDASAIGANMHAIRAEK